MDLGGEDETSFLLRRTAEERRKAAATSCMVRAVHEEMIETYEERLHASEAEAAALAALLAKIDAE